MLTDREVLSTINMLRSEHLDVRTVTMGINLFDCASSDFDTFAYKVRSKIFRYAEKLVETCDLVGYLELEDLKSSAKKALGDDFYLKDFHKFYLEIGPCYFDLIQDRMNDWIDRIKAQ